MTRGVRACPLCGGDGVVSREVETRAWLEHRWLYPRTGLVQTALPADVDLADYERVNRAAGRWYGPWQLRTEDP
jgi:hypothetical protein